MNSFEKQWLAKHGIRGQDPGHRPQRFTLYGLGDFAELEKSAATDKSIEGKQMLAIVLIEQGRLEEALKLSVVEEDAEEKPWHLAEMAIACRSAGQEAQANEWLDKAIKAMEGGNEDLAHAAIFLSRATPPTESELEGGRPAAEGQSHVPSPSYGQKFPRGGPRNFSRSPARFNLERSFPYHLVNRVTAASQNK